MNELLRWDWNYHRFRNPLTVATKVIFNIFNVSVYVFEKAEKIRNAKLKRI
jgi:hypothetical protein